MLNLLEMLKKEAVTWAGVTVSYRDDWDCDHFLVGTKGFCLLGKNKENERVMTIKGLPNNNAAMRELYPFVVPGYYSNKVHWISIKLEQSSLSSDELISLLRESYQIVFEQLPEKTKKEISRNIA
ncbi:MmcQ/YjbR family DNA-binding protein [Xenorhabdus innexi]|uniref:MmcQ/YjbR family DNA-binding protein n=1 Tax=Xenorhabdus innexi TaxID=290109 RepID=A0A1N6MRU6_9GAMM|nr:MmcQ/YjbR family DNA-binding protein [Xenorhabdus innexi]PHM27978.1 hypothetical protein Xinn_03908 [Xenorhabdus innexi]SIP71568.1 conserved hypothetical protein [Xenorhabdus innexi]